MADEEIIARRPLKPETQHPETQHSHALRVEAESSPGPAPTGPAGQTRLARPAPTLARALRLLGLTTILPGRAQVMAGPRGLGRLALCVTLLCWLLLAAGAVLWAVHRGAFLNLLLAPGWSQALSACLLILAAGWALLYAATLRAARPARMTRARGGVVVLVTLLLAGLTSGSLVFASTALQTGSSALDKIFHAGVRAEPTDGRYNILLLGGDGGSDRTGRRPDSISVLSINAATGDSATFSIPRNLQNAPFPTSSPMASVYPNGYNCGDECIINSLYGLVNEKYASLYPGAADAGAQAMMETASEILGIRVSNYILVDMGGFSDVVDAMGGVTVNSGGWVPITSGEIPNTYPVRHYPPSEWMPPGELRLDGYHAEWFARSREFTSDYNRIKRQQCIQESMIRQLTPLRIATRFGALAEAGAKLMESNIDRGQVGYFADALLASRGKQQSKLTIGEPDFPQLFSTYPNFDEVRQRVKKTLADQGGSSSASGGGLSLPVAMSLASVSALPQGTATALPAKSTAPDGTKITPEYLTRLAREQDDATLAEILSDNGTCSPSSSRRP